LKKIIVILLVLVLSFSFVSCKADKTSGNNAAPAVKPAENTVTPQPATPQAAAPVNEALQPAREGKVTGLSIGIGSTLQEAIAQMGEPTALDNFEGTSYVSYELVDLILDKIIDDTKAEASVTGIILSEGYELYGVKVGMTPAQIKEILGTPTNEEMENDSESTTWRMDYDCGDYKLSFYANDKDSATVSAYLSKKQ
jgi:hypothetical protein